MKPVELDGLAHRLEVAVTAGLLRGDEPEGCHTDAALALTNRPTVAVRLVERERGRLPAAAGVQVEPHGRQATIHPVDVRRDDGQRGVGGGGVVAVAENGLGGDELKGH